MRAWMKFKWISPLLKFQIPAAFNILVPGSSIVKALRFSPLSQELSRLIQQAMHIFADMERDQLAIIFSSQLDERY